jgi:glycosyltransferase involved in cell wall biosynthesis
LNIVFANATQSWGGIKTWMVQLSSFLQRRGHHVRFVCREHDRLLEVLAAENVSCQGLHFGADYAPRSIQFFRHLFQAQETQVLVTNISKELRTAGVAARWQGGLLHVNRLGLPGDLKHNWKNRLEYSQLVDQVVVPSKHLFDHFSQQPYLASKLHFFHNAVRDTEFIDKSADAEIKIAMVAVLSKRKQVDLLLQALQTLADLNWTLHVGGGGPERENLEALAAELGLRSRVHFHGMVEPYVFLRDKHIAVLNSQEESFSNALLEYMAASCAVISTVTGGTGEVLQDGENGLAVSGKPDGSLEAALRRLLTDRDLRNSLAHAGHARVMRYFSQSTIYGQIEEHLQRSYAHKQGSR